MEKIIKRFFGIRKIKSIVALFICFLVWQPIYFLMHDKLGFEGIGTHPYFAYMYAIIEMRQTLERTKTLGRARMKATLISLVIAITFIALTTEIKQYFANVYLWNLVEIIIVMIGVLCCLYFADFFHCEPLCAIAASTFIICIIALDDGNLYVYALMRIFQTSFGIASAYVINKYVFPPKKDNDTPPMQACQQPPENQKEEPNMVSINSAPESASAQNK